MRGYRIPPMSIFEFESIESNEAVGLPASARERRKKVRLLKLPSARCCSRRVNKVIGADGRLYALKTLAPLGSPVANNVPATLSLAFREEYLNLAAVSALDGFATAYEYGAVRSVPAILMEWVPGHSLASLHRLLSRREGAMAPGLPGRTVASLGCTLCRILLDARGVQPAFSHRDISLRNVLVRAGRRPIARQIEDDAFDLCIIDLGSSIASCRQPTFTMRTDIWRYGTPEFAPPEMLTSDIRELSALRTSPTIDVYETCSLLYTLYAGHTPFKLDGSGTSSPYRYKLEHAPIPLVPRTKAEDALTQAIMAGIRNRQSERIGLTELASILESHLMRLP